VKYAWIEENRKEFPLAVMCELLGVSRAGYYDWQQREPSLKQQDDKRLEERVVELFWQGRGCYGTRRIKRLLAAEGRTVSRRRIGRLLKEQGLVCQTRKKRKPVTTDSDHDHPIAPNRLDRQFQVEQPNQCYVGDITYIDTEEGWLYLAIWIDLYSRTVVGWSMKDHMRSSLVCEALKMAIGSRETAPGLMVHSDRGSQYASNVFRQLLEKNEFIPSMSRKAQCWDNAVAESFFHTLKTELVFQQRYATHEQAKQAIFEYIEIFYNRQRLHSTIGYQAPLVYEQQQAALGVVEAGSRA
jgi:transposase InsO family protein